ncbi:MAG: Fic family protein [Candidatus Absconditabacteria bacterium]|nr:Fic family protein [Candidatus Absconditabacteria bacterium]
MQKITQLLNTYDFETIGVLKQLSQTHKSLGELKGLAETIPNMFILITTLSLQEAKESSEIENIITTNDELYQSNTKKKYFTSIPAKEVYNYADALFYGYQIVSTNNLITTKDIIHLQQMIEENNAGIRKLPGTELKNDKTGEIIYTPPQSHKEIIDLMSDLEWFINTSSQLDPLIKMAIIHHQFESIHPFYDANGRVGRVINVLYLVKEGLLDSPILYLSRSINKHKNDYYNYLQIVRDQGTWETWVIWMLEMIEQTAKHTIIFIKNIKNLMMEYKHTIRSRLPKIYSQELLNNIFKHPYTKVEFLRKDLGCTRITAVKYLEELVKIGILKKIKSGRDNYYINTKLFALLQNISG